MLLSLILPLINPHMTRVLIDRVHTKVGAQLAPGAALFDLTIDLSDISPHDCPPISHYRIVFRDRAWVRRLDVMVGSDPAVAESLALFSTAPDEPLDLAPTRGARIATVGITPEFEW